jgi:hypothetical protein
MFEDENRDLKQRPEFFSNFGWPDYLFYLQKLQEI